MTRPRSLRLSIALAVAAMAVVALVGSPAGAHGGEGEMAVDSSVREGDAVTFTVRITYVDDGHGVPDATVTAVVVGGSGAPTSFAPTAEEGVYTGTVAVAPGATVRFTSVEPATSTEVVAPEAASTTAPPTTTTPTTTTPSTTAPATTVPTTTDETDDAAAPIAATDDDDDSSSTPLVLGAIAIAIVALGLGTVVLARRRAAA